MALNQNWPLVAHQACFTAGGQAAYPMLWDDLTPRVTDYTMKQGKQFELDAVQATEFDCTVLTEDEALNPANTGSPYNSGGKSLVPYRWYRSWHAWPLSGNLVNAGNQQWLTLYGKAGSLADAAGFEGGVGTWGVVAGCTLAASATHVHDGTQSMAVTWASTAGGAGVANLSTILPPLRSGQAYVASLWLWIGAGPAVTVWCNGTSVTSTGSTGAWQRVVVPFTADSTVTPTLSVYAAGATTSGQQVWVDSVQVEIGSTASAWTSTGTIVYPGFGGYIERYPLSWAHQGMQGWTKLTAVDGRALLSRATMQDVIIQDVIQDQPTHAWPLRDDAKQTSAMDAVSSTVGGLSLTPVGSPAAVTTTFGGKDGPGVDSATCLAFTPTDTGDGFAAVADWTATPLAGPWTVDWWFRVTPAQNTRQARMVTVWAASGEEVGVQVDPTGTVTLTHTTAGGAVDATVTSPAWWADGAWHHAALQGTWDGTNAHETLTLDGQTVGATTRTTGAAMTLSGLLLGYARAARTDTWVGDLAMVAAYPTALPAARIHSHWLAGRTGFAGDTTGHRVARILGWVGWQGPLSTPDGGTRHGPVHAMGGKYASDVAQEVATTEQGSFIGLLTGAMAVTPRADRTSQPVSAWTFGENESPYLSGTSAEKDPTYIYNAITVTRDQGVAQTVTSAASAAAYGARTYQVSTTHTTEEDAASLAAYLAGQYADAHLRVSEVTLNPASNPALWPVALGVKFGDRATWKRRTKAGVTMTVDGFVDLVEHSVAPGKFEVKVRLNPAPTFQAGLVGDATYGLVGSTLLATY